MKYFKINKQFRKYIPVFSIMLAIIILLGTSYALLRNTQKGTTTYTMSVGTLSVAFLDSETNALTLTNMYPMSEAEGMKQNNVLEFTVKNIGDYEAQYNVYIEQTSGDLDWNNVIRYSVNKNETRWQSSRIINDNKFIDYESYLDIGEEASYKLKIWLDYDADVTYMNKTFTAKIVVESFQLTKAIANKPNMSNNMIPVYYDDEEDTWIKADRYNDDPIYKWYDYDNRMWANAVTVNDNKRTYYQDAAVGTKVSSDDMNAMFVWIPRYAYKIAYYTDENKNELNGYHLSTGYVNADKVVTNVDEVVTLYGDIEVSFLKGTSNKISGMNGNNRIASDENYIIHPSFQNGTSNNFTNGEWDKEISGIWVAKFEAGFASGGNNAPVVATNVTYSDTMVWIPGNTAVAFNWLDGTYGSTPMKIKYPVFLPNTYTNNFIHVGDTYSLNAEYTKNGNIYGFSSGIDMHLMKNSEWGMVTYLTLSKYGLGTTPEDNITDLSSIVANAYSVTGGGDYKANINQSTTGNIYGIYDMSGAAVERVPAFLSMAGNEALNANHAKALTYKSGVLRTISDKYVTIYSYDSSNSADPTSNYRFNTIYGDALRETSRVGNNFNSFFGASSIYLYGNAPIIFRGDSYYYGTSTTAITSYAVNNGFGSFAASFRVSLITE